MMSYINIPHDRPLDHRTAFQILQTHAKQQPNKDAIVFRDENLNRVALTFSEYDTKSSSLAAGLLEIGVVRGDRVLVLLPSYVEFVLFHMALNRIGAIMIAPEENYYWAVCGTPNLACVIARVDPTVMDNDKVISEIKTSLHQNLVKGAVLVGSDADADLLDHPKAYTHQKMYEMAANNPDSTANVHKAETQVQMDDPCLVIFTSGSTGLSKPIEFSHHAFVNAIHTSINFVEQARDSVYFSNFPFDWVSGITYGIGSCIVQGITYVSFPPKVAITGEHLMTIMKIIQEECVTLADLMLYLMHEIALHNEQIKTMNLEKLKYIIIGGQPTPLPIVKKMFDIWPDVTVIDVYASTEANSIARQKITKKHLDSMNHGVMETIPGMEVKIVDEAGQLVPIGVRGEILLRSSWISFCNWDYVDPAYHEGQVNTSKNPNGWFSTKDFAVVVNNNCIRLLGRRDFMIKVATESVPPALIENTLQEHADVKKVCVVGVPDERLYQKICACVILKKDLNDNADALCAKFEEWGKDKFDESSIGFVMKPHYYVFLESFPLTRTGKVSTIDLRDIAIKELGLE